MKLAVFVLSMGGLVWIFFDQLQEKPFGPIAANNGGEGRPEPLVPGSPVPVNPPLPEVTRRKIEAIQYILTSEELDYPELFARYSAEENLKILVLERWIESDYRAALDVVAGTELESLAWKLVGLGYGTEVLSEYGNLDEEHRGFLLAGIAEGDPRAVIRFLASEKAALPLVTIDSILHGLAKIDIFSALEFDLRSSREWAYQSRFGTGHHFFFERLREWIAQNPLLATRWLEENRYEGGYLTSSFVQELDKVAPEMLQELIDRIPTGATKTSFLEFRKSGREARGTPRGLYSCDGSNRDQKIFLSTLEAAATAEVSQWPELLEGKWLQIFPASRAGLVREVLVDRWMEQSPSTLPELHYPNEKLRAYALKRWVEFDEEGALAHLETQIKEDKAKDFLLLEYAMTRSGKVSAARLFKLIDRFPDFLNEGATEMANEHLFNFSNDRLYSGLLVRIAREDRDGLEGAGQLGGDWGVAIRRSLVHAWLEEDFEWVLGKVVEWQAEEEFISDDYSKSVSTPVFLDNFEKIPGPLREALIEDGNVILTGATLDWLENANPRISHDHLKKIFNRSEDRAYYFLPIQSEEVAARLVNQSSILSEESKCDIVATLYYSQSLQSIAKAKAWLDGIPKRYHKDKDELFELAKLQEAIESQRWGHVARRESLSEVLSTLDSTNDLRGTLRMARESERYWEIWLETIPKLNAVEIIRILKAARDHQLPFDLKGELLDRALAESPDFLPQLEGFIGKLAWAWGKWEPPTAASWAVNISYPRVRENAVNAVYFEWQKYDKAEARAWVLTLPEDLQKGLDLR